MGTHTPKPSAAYCAEKSSAELPCLGGVLLVQWFSKNEGARRSEKETEISYGVQVQQNPTAADFPGCGAKINRFIEMETACLSHRTCGGAPNHNTHHAENPRTLLNGCNTIKRSSRVPLLFNPLSLACCRNSSVDDDLSGDVSRTCSPRTSLSFAAKAAADLPPRPMLAAL